MVKGVMLALMFDDEQNQLQLNSEQKAVVDLYLLHAGVVLAEFDAQLLNADDE